MRLILGLLAIGPALVALSACGDPASTGTGSGTGARDQIRIVGSSTVYPFSKAVGEHLAQAGAIKAPVVEANGTGGGIAQFCAGVGLDTPDLADASRQMKASEFETCRKNGVTDIVEVPVGIDGIALAESNKGARMSLTTVDLYKALAAKPFGKPQTAKTWRDVNPALPNTPIQVFGPPTTSGTRDAFDELIMKAGCKSDPAMKALEKSDKDRFTAICTELRRDGGYNEQGENDNLIVQKLVANPDTLGIFGYSYLEQNGDKLHGTPINGVVPSYAAIANGSYPGSRPLFVYVKKAHLGKVPGIEAFLAEYQKANGPDGYLKSLGLVVLPEARRQAAQKVVQQLPSLSPSSFK